MKNTEENPTNPNSALKELIQMLKLQLRVFGDTHSFPLPWAHPASKPHSCLQLNSTLWKTVWNFLEKLNAEELPWWTSG